MNTLIIPNVLLISFLFLILFNQTRGVNIGKKTFYANPTNQSSGLLLCLSHAKFTTAVLLIVEIVLFQQLVAPFIQPPLAPVLSPVCSSFHLRLGKETCLINLLQALPSRGSKSSGEVSQAKLASSKRRGIESVAEALQASME